MNTSFNPYKITFENHTYFVKEDARGCETFPFSQQDNRFMEAYAVRDDNELVTVIWEVVDGFWDEYDGINLDLSDACDWDNPYTIR